MGQTGRDVQLSEAALSYFPYAVECKNRAKIAIFTDYEQAVSNKGQHTPLLVLKQNQSKPLVVLDLEDFFRILNESKQNTRA